MRIILLTMLIFFVMAGGYFATYHTDSAVKKQLSNQVAFDEFLGVNSIRESNKNIIRDQYQVARFHRIFAMDSYMFTGTEFVVGSNGNKRVVDLSIPHDEYPEDRMGFNPSKTAKFDFDGFLSEMKDSGLKSIPVLAKNLLYNNVPASNSINIWQIPWDDGGDPENPLDYKAYASFLYQFTARYGKNKLTTQGGTIDPETLKVTEDNVLKAGLDLVFAIEPGNEMDKDWFTEREQASARALAAFLSAAIDGHMGLMGQGHGILQADPQMKILFPSPADIKTAYVLNVLDELKRIRAEAPKFGAEVIPEDNLILTVHFYPFKNRKWRSSQTSEIVEKTKVIEQSIDFIHRVKALYNCPIYMTETGYDKLRKGVSAIGTPTTRADEMDTKDMSTHAHAKHILRLLLTMYGAGYDKVFLFTLSDPVALDAKEAKVKYATTGLTRKNGTKDPAWHVINFLRKKMTGYHLKSADFSQDIKLMRLMRGDTLAYLFWSGTHDDVTTTVDLSMENTYSSASIIRLSDISNDFLPTISTDHKKKLKVKATEFPALIIFTPGSHSAKIF